tara:strand:- start:1023 stop:3431 length:2409 start_codon:yes stop_codon:yes gene_type:complete
MEDNFKDSFDENINLKEEILRYVSFWPYFLIVLSVCFFTSFLYLRYTNFEYESKALIEILDPAQDSEMALPTELTVFNRSMINLENEITILNSFSLHNKVVSDLDFNVSFFHLGNIKTTQLTKENWYKDYEITFKIDTDIIQSPSSFEIYSENNKLRILAFDISGDISNEYQFDSLTSTEINHELPFEITILDDDNLSTVRKLKINPVDFQTNVFRSQFQAEFTGKDSDQLILKLSNQNILIAEKYLNALLKSFDNDGVSDRQLEYKRTIEFVDKREKILKNELQIIELRKQNFKQNNNLSDLTLDAGNNIDLKYSYNSELFKSQSQRTIANFLMESISDKNYDYLPLNIGLDDFDLNSIITDYNNIITKRNRYITEAGPNNVLAKSLESQLDNIVKNISNSIQNYLSSLDIKIDNLKNKELEFQNLYSNVPENEKTLRSIERELSIKEALYLLLLQKREEAAINLAVVKPTIKIIDYPITNPVPIFPRPNVVYLSALVTAVLLYFGLLYFWFLLDDKIHNKEHLLRLLNPDIPVIAEIPFIPNAKEIDIIDNKFSRSPLVESVRMLLSNLRFLNSESKDKGKCTSLLFTSSIKGEGKTLASVNAAAILAADNNKVLLIGADLRNPQIHKLFEIEKDRIGLSELLYKNDNDNFQKYLNKFENLDVLFSGAIPPNPTSLLGSKAFKNLLKSLKEHYDYILIDSAPCLLVSDTFQLVNYVDFIIYLFRANYTQNKITNYINELYSKNDVKSLSVVFNAVGNSKAYGYKYGYQYGYQYGYKYGYNYGYNYGYGYGYGSDEESKTD